MYPLYENPWRVTQTYAVHAHNDYLEGALELRLAGILLVLLFLGLWGTAVCGPGARPHPAPFTLEAAISSTTILIHSLVDFPLRTAAIAACFGVCLALLVDHRTARPREKAELRQARIERWVRYYERAFSGRWFDYRALLRPRSFLN